VRVFWYAMCVCVSCTDDALTSTHLAKVHSFKAFKEFKFDEYEEDTEGSQQFLSVANLVAHVLQLNLFRRKAIVRQAFRIEIAQRLKFRQQRFHLPNYHVLLDTKLCMRVLWVCRVCANLYIHRQRQTEVFQLRRHPFSEKAHPSRHLAECTSIWNCTHACKQKRHNTHTHTPTSNP